MESNENLKLLSTEIVKLIDSEMDEHPKIILGVNVGTLDGTLLTSKVNKKIDLSKYEISAANSSILFLSSKLLKGSLDQKLSYNLVTGKEKVILSILTENITMIAYLKRELAELEGLNTFIVKLKKLALRISAFVETSDLLKDEIFVALKRAIPNAIVIAIITKDGLPIKVQSSMQEPIFSAMISALYKISDILLEKTGLEYSVINGEHGSIIIHELDENRILCVAVPEAEESKLGTYIARIKTLLG